MTLRELFINWLTASRFIRSLETRIAELRQDMTERLAEKDAQIKLLRGENAALKFECDRMRTVLMPFGSPAGAAYAQQYASPVKPPPVPVFDGPDSWDAELNKLYEKERNGLPSEGREEVNQPSANDGSQPLS